MSTRQIGNAIIARRMGIHGRRYGRKGGTIAVKTIPLEPLASKILCERIEPDRRSRGGVIIPDNAKQPSTMKARVLSVGPCVNEDNGRRRIEVGDLLTFAQFAGTEIDFQVEKYLALHVDDVLAVIQE